jgi:hypothetical protein
MIIYILAISLIVIAAGLVTLIHGVAHAPLGFEDELGFHSVAAAGEAEVAPAYPEIERRGAGANPGGRRYVGLRRRYTDFGSDHASWGAGAGSGA